MAASLLSMALMMLAQAAGAPSTASQATAAVPPAAPEPRCGVPAGPNAIIICAPRAEGYRINPDVLAARRQRKLDPGAPRPNNSKARPDCATVGPAPCVMAGVNLLGAALTAVQMAQRVAKGEEIGSMFKTEPASSEYQLYQAAKAEREAREAAGAAAKVKAKATAANAAAASGATPAK